MGNGQSYPDITSLPLLAAYFDCSVDELLILTRSYPQRDPTHLSITKRRLSNKNTKRSPRAGTKFYQTVLLLLPVLVTDGPFT